MSRAAAGIRIAMLRHAPTAWNAARRLQGRSDIALSPEGRALAAGWRLPAALEIVDSATWLTSPLLRCRETAELMLRNMGCSMEMPEMAPELTVEPRLIERGFGDWEGETLAGLRARYGEEMAQWEAKGWDFRPPGGESPRDVLQRSMPLLQEMLRQERSMICVTHRSVIRAFYAAARGWDMLGRPPEKLRDGCVHLFDYDGGGLAIRRLNLSLGDTAEPAARPGGRVAGS